MTLSESTTEAARGGDRRAMEALFRQTYPAVYQLSRALCGDQESADRVTDICFRHALNVIPSWSANVDPEHWFAHHALQTARAVCVGRPESAADVLVTALPPEERTPAYLAMVRGIRRLPPQQAEAFILHYGERWNSRLIGVAMDCSTQAADNHLKAADATLKALAGEEFEALTARLRQAIIALSPSSGETQRFVSLRLGAWSAKRAARRIKRLVMLLIAAAALAAAWYYRDAILARVMPAGGQ